MTNNKERNDKIQEIKDELTLSDRDMPRIVDDVIDTLIKLKVIPLNSLSDISCLKLERRRYLRDLLCQLVEEDLEHNPVTQRIHDCSSCNHNHNADACLEKVQ